MQELPSYFETLAEALPVEVMEILSSIEVSLDKLGHTDHQERIYEGIMVDDDEVMIRDLADEAIVYYRAAITSVLNAQGITLSAPAETKLNLLADVLNAVTHLGTEDYAGELDDIEIEDDENVLSYFAAVLAALLETTPGSILSIIDNVRAETVDAIKAGNGIQEVEQVITSKSKERFMSALGNDKSGVVCDWIRLSGEFGYQLETAVAELGEAIADTVDDTAAVREVRLLVLGSGVEDKMVDLEINETIELLFEPRRAFKLMAKVRP